MDLRRRPTRSLQVIDAIGAEIVVLQEADKRIAPRPTALPHGMIEDNGWKIAPLSVTGGSLGWHGNAMIFREAVDFMSGGHIALPGLEPRGAIYGEFATSIGRVRVVGMHLGLVRRYRLLQVAAVVRHLRDLAPCATVLAGDFNEWGKGVDMDNIAQGFKFLPPKPSFPALRPVAALDRFATDENLLVMAQGVHGARPAHIASDHLPIWVTLGRQAAR